MSHERSTYKDYQIIFDNYTMYIYRPESMTSAQSDKRYEIDDSDKNMLRLARNWIDDDIVSRMPAPPISELVWIPVTERYPSDSRQVLIREGNNIATAHWFASTKRPVGKDEWVDGGSMWANQHQHIFGSRIDNPTHWMDCEKLLAIPVQDEKAKIDVPEITQEDHNSHYISNEKIIRLKALGYVVASYLSDYWPIDFRGRKITTTPCRSEMEGWLWCWIEYVRTTSNSVEGLK